jgi:hypothetical protein
VTGYNNGKQAVVSVVIGSELTADFKADGNLGGSAGCNSYFASPHLTHAINIHLKTTCYDIENLRVALHLKNSV